MIHRTHHERQSAANSADRYIALSSAVRWDHADDNRPLAGTIPLGEDQALPPAEPELGAADRDVDRGTQHRAQNMRLRVTFAMAKAAVARTQPLKVVQHVGGDIGVSILRHDHRTGGVGYE